MQDITPYVGQTITATWNLIPNGDGVNDLGWYIDDVSVHYDIRENDLEITKEASAAHAIIGESLLYTLTVFNHGPYYANSILLRDYLPSGVKLNAITHDIVETSCSEASQGIISCSEFWLGIGDSETIVIDVTPSTTETQAGDQIVNYAFVSAKEAEAYPSNNGASLITTLIDTPITAPQIYSVTPEAAVIPVLGGKIYINGDNFTPGMSAYLDDYVLFDVTTISPHLLEATVMFVVPAGTYDVKVVGPGGESNILLNAFTVLEGPQPQPTVNNIFPQQGLNNVPVSVFIYGSNFSPGMSASLHDNDTLIRDLENVQFISNDIIRATIPITLPIGQFDLKVINDFNEFDWLYDAYRALDHESASTDDLYTINNFDLWMQPPSAQQGVTTTLGINIRRQGGQAPLTNVAVDYYLNGPSDDEGGILLGRASADILDQRSTTTATLTWAVNLPPGMHTFYGVIDPDGVVPELNETNNVISRSIRILPYGPELIPPQIDDFSINMGAVLTDKRQVRLNVSASAGSLLHHDSSNSPAAGQPEYLLYIEYQYIQSENDWVAVARTEWLPFDEANTDFPWKLHPVPGVHYLQVWVADNLGNISIQPGLALINLLLDQAHLAEQELHIFRYPSPAAKNYLLRLTSISGDADIGVWHPDGTLVAKSEIDSTYDELQFTTTMDGAYHIEVEGYTSVDYRLEIIPLSTPVVYRVAPQIISSPMVRGRGTGATSTEPGENIGLPELPPVLFLPFIR
jgi:uncharacterized repeat protein (TIGR01451 family)